MGRDHYGDRHAAQACGLRTRRYRGHNERCGRARRRHHRVLRSHRRGEKDRGRGEDARTVIAWFAEAVRALPGLVNYLPRAIPLVGAAVTLWRAVKAELRSAR